MHSSKEKPMTSREVAEFLNISLSTLYKYTYSKRIPFYKPSGKKMYFYLSDIQEFISSKKGGK